MLGGAAAIAHSPATRVKGICHIQLNRGLVQCLAIMWGIGTHCFVSLELGMLNCVTDLYSLEKNRDEPKRTKTEPKLVWNEPDFGSIDRY